MYQVPRYSEERATLPDSAVHLKATIAYAPAAIRSAEATSTLANMQHIHLRSSLDALLAQVLCGAHCMQSGQHVCTMRRSAKTNVATLAISTTESQLSLIHI